MGARDRPRITPRRPLCALALLLAGSTGSAVTGARADSPPLPLFSDWTAVSNNVATGTLLGSPIVLSGSHVWNPPQSVLDGSWPYFDGPDFSPALPTTDEIQISGAPGYAYTIQFGAPVTNPVIEIGSLGSRLDFPSGTDVVRLSGDSNFAVSGSTVTGALAPVGRDGVNDANGTVELVGTFQSISFSATPTYPPGSEDGILLQIGAPPPPPPAPVAASLVASFTANPDPTCVGTPTTLDARASTAGTGGPIVSYMYAYLTGFPDSRVIVLATSNSPLVTVEFPWSRQESSGLQAGMSPWVRDPVDLTLMITDRTGYTATVTKRINFAQHTSDEPRAGCPDSTDPPVPTTPEMVDGRPTASGGWANVPLRCGTTGVGCFGNLFITVPSLYLEGERARVAQQDEQLKALIAKGQATPATSRTRSAPDGRRRSRSVCVGTPTGASLLWPAARHAQHRPGHLTRRAHVPARDGRHSDSARAHSSSPLTSRSVIPVAGSVVTSSVGPTRAAAHSRQASSWASSIHATGLDGWTWRSIAPSFQWAWVGRSPRSNSTWGRGPSSPSASGR